MIWYLIVCTSLYGGAECLPAQIMPSKNACAFVAKGYRSTRYGSNVSARCVGVRKA